MAYFLKECENSWLNEESSCLLKLLRLYYDLLLFAVNLLLCLIYKLYFIIVLCILWKIVSDILFDTFFFTFRHLLGVLVTSPIDNKDRVLYFSKQMFFILLLLFMIFSGLTTIIASKTIQLHTYFEFSSFSPPIYHVQKSQEMALPFLPSLNVTT